MTLEYSVHRVSTHPVPRTVVMDGEEVPAVVDRLEVELVPHDAANGTVTLGFTGRAIAAARELFGVQVADHALDDQGRVIAERWRTAPTGATMAISVTPVVAAPAEAGDGGQP